MSGLIKLLHLLGEAAQDRSGATAIEYGLVAALITLAVAGGMSATGHNVNDRFSSVNEVFGITSSSGPSR